MRSLASLVLETITTQRHPARQGLFREARDTLASYSLNHLVIFGLEPHVYRIKVLICLLKAQYTLLCHQLCHVL